ncbi:hypothetical protein DIURU_005082 [Diutina rugosa]|uniref:Uncharacterized protein n=1 Tax=Diutina rugosa TaxID=5481 RepID=A0A642UEN5_DIURU|nr:uncharacterized protein DIURU_005082 [Diutina rugosa]KAA8897651.1 hypothetical protein DIURU_005082 [Diutina rugosa]
MVAASKQYMAREMVKVEAILKKRSLAAPVELGEYSDANHFFQWKSQLLRLAGKGTYWFRQYVDFLFDGTGASMTSVLAANDPRAPPPMLHEKRLELTKVDTYRRSVSNNSSRHGSPAPHPYGQFHDSHAPPLPRLHKPARGSSSESDEIFSETSMAESNDTNPSTHASASVASAAPVPPELVPSYDKAVFHLVRKTTSHSLWTQYKNAPSADQLIREIVDRFGRYTPLMALQLLTEDPIADHSGRAWDQVYNTQIEVKYGAMTLSPEQFTCVLMLTKFSPQMRAEVVNHLQSNHLEWTMWNVCAYMDGRRRSESEPPPSPPKSKPSSLRSFKSPSIRSFRLKRG